MESRLRDVSLYGSLLRGLAAGQNTPTELGNLLGGSDRGNVARQLARLGEIGLVRQVRPIVQARPRDVRWEIADPFLRFWHRYVAPAGAGC